MPTLSAKGSGLDEHSKRHEKNRMCCNVSLRRTLAPEAQVRVVRPGEARLITSGHHPYICLGSNEAFSELTGVASDQVDVSSIKKLFGVAAIAAWDSAIETATKDGAHDFDIFCNTAAGKTEMLSVRASLLPHIPDEKECEQPRPMLFIMTRAADARSMTSSGVRVVVQNKPPFHIESVSPGWALMYGMSSAAVLGRSLKMVQGPCTDMRAVRTLMDAVTQGVEKQVSYITYNAEGKRMLTHHHIFPLCSDSAVVEANATEIIELAEEALQVQKGISLLMDASSTHDITHVSDDLCRLLNKDRKAIVGQSVVHLLDGSSKGTCQDLIAYALSFRPRAKQHDLVNFSADLTKVIPARTSSLAVVMDDCMNPTKVLVRFEQCSTDGSEIVGLTDALAKQDTLDSLRVGAVIASTHAPYTIRHANKTWCATYGLTSAQVTGRSTSIVHGPLSDCSLLTAMIHKARQGESSTETLTSYHADGEPVSSTILILPVKSEVGIVEHFCLVLPQQPQPPPDKGEPAQRDPPPQSVTPLDAPARVGCGWKWNSSALSFGLEDKEEEVAVEEEQGQQQQLGAVVCAAAGAGESVAHVADKAAQEVKRQLRHLLLPRTQPPFLVKQPAGVGVTLLGAGGSAAACEARANWELPRRQPARALKQVVKQVVKKPSQPARASQAAAAPLKPPAAGTPRSEYRDACSADIWGNIETDFGMEGTDFGFLAAPLPQGLQLPPAEHLPLQSEAAVLRERVQQLQQELAVERRAKHQADARLLVAKAQLASLQEASEVRAEELAATARELHRAYAQMEVERGVSKLALTALQATLCMQPGGDAEQSGSPAKVGGVHAAETESMSQGLPNLSSDAKEMCCADIESERKEPQLQHVQQHDAPLQGIGGYEWQYRKYACAEHVGEEMSSSSHTYAYAQHPLPLVYGQHHRPLSPPASKSWRYQAELWVDPLRVDSSQSDTPSDQSFTPSDEPYTPSERWECQEDESEWAEEHRGASGEEHRGASGELGHNPPQPLEHQPQVTKVGPLKGSTKTSCASM